MAVPNQEAIFLASADLTIRNVKTLHVELGEQVRTHAKTTILLPGEYTTDLSFVQLIEAARICAEENGRIERMSRQDIQFWFHEEEAL